MATTSAMSTARIIPPVYCRILSKFPKGCSFSFAYGSAVKQQTGSKKSEQMVDLIITAEDSQKWHVENLKINAEHYSFLKYLGGNMVSKYQENVGARVYFNTLVPIAEEGLLIKYGVVSKQDLLADLLNWDHLYLAGRLHKPVQVIDRETDARLRSALQDNLAAATRTALLMLPEKFSEFEFYHTISNLSYSGDFRMIFGENKNKVKNIVQPQLLEFRRLYDPTIKSFKNLVHFPNNSSELNQDCEQDVSVSTKHYHLSQLPSNPLRLMELYYYKKTGVTEAGDVLGNLARDEKCSEILRKALDAIVWQSSVRQSLKGILTAGIIKSFNYSARKISKMFK